MLIRYAEGTGRTPGALLDEALRWWEKGGREYAESALYEIAQRRAAPKSSRRPSNPAAG